MHLRFGTEEGKVTGSQTGSQTKAFPRSLNLLVFPVIYLHVDLTFKVNISWILLQDRLSSSHHMRRRARQLEHVPLRPMHPWDFSKTLKGSFCTQSSWNRRGDTGRTLRPWTRIHPQDRSHLLIHVAPTPGTLTFLKHTCPLTFDSNLGPNPCFHRVSEKHLKLISTPWTPESGYECIQEKDDLTPSPKSPWHR